MDIETKQTNIPSFTLYLITSQDIKTCYESQKYKIICSLNGPYFDRKIASLAPQFNINISTNDQSQNKEIINSKLCKYQQKVKQVLKTMIVQGKYERMVFDINFEVIQNNDNNPSSFLLSPILTLLSYTCGVKCLQITSLFSCHAIVQSNDEIIWQRNKNEQGKILILCTQGRQKNIILTLFDGQFSLIQYSKLVNLLQQANMQTIKFINEKVNEAFDIFNQ